MERLQELISQLQEQHQRQVDPSQMLLTLRLLEAELTNMSGRATINRGSAKVAVMMPSSMKMYAGQQPIPEARTVPEFRTSSATANGNGTANSAGISTPAAEIRDIPSIAAAPEIQFPEPRSSELRPPELKTVNSPDPKTPIRPLPVTREAETDSWPYDSLTDIPTFAHQQPARELNDVMGNNGASLNDKLKGDVIELAAALNDAPVRDLKKAIGVNDRYVFISQLFRGDEVMYERSIKTINGFRILPEAEYWMERELKVKLGWDENREATRHFYQLVKRRFS
jgi:hypothetical protein